MLIAKLNLCMACYAYPNKQLFKFSPLNAPAYFSPQPTHWPHTCDYMPKFGVTVSLCF